jgi:hypothetical protein
VVRRDVCGPGGEAVKGWTTKTAKIAKNSRVFRRDRLGRDDPLLNVFGAQVRAHAVQGALLVADTGNRVTHLAFLCRVDFFSVFDVC